MPPPGPDHLPGAQFDEPGYGGDPRQYPPPPPPRTGPPPFVNETVDRRPGRFDIEPPQFGPPQGQRGAAPGYERTEPPPMPDPGYTERGYGAGPASYDDRYPREDQYGPDGRYRGEPHAEDRYGFGAEPAGQPPRQDRHLSEHRQAPELGPLDFGAPPDLGPVPDHGAAPDYGPRTEYGPAEPRPVERLSDYDLGHRGVPPEGSQLPPLAPPVPDPVRDYGEPAVGAPTGQAAPPRGGHREPAAEPPGWDARRDTEHEPTQFFRVQDSGPHEPPAAGYEPAGYEPPNYDSPNYEHPGYEPPGYKPPGYEPTGHETAQYDPAGHLPGRDSYGGQYGPAGHAGHPDYPEYPDYPAAPGPAERGHGERPPRSAETDYADYAGRANGYHEPSRPLDEPSDFRSDFGGRSERRGFPDRDDIPPTERAFMFDEAYSRNR